MKHKRAVIALAIVLGLVVGAAGCAKNSSKGGDTPDGQNVQLANPWRDVTEAEAKELCPHSLRAPDGSENASWSVMESDENPLVQLSFDWYGNTFTARAQKTDDKKTDISGMFYEWDYQSDIVLSNWADGTMKATYYRSITEDEWVDLCVWYDEDAGIAYSVSVTSDDLDGFDLQAVAEALYTPAE